MLLPNGQAVPASATIELFLESFQVHHHFTSLPLAQHALCSAAIFYLPSYYAVHRSAARATQPRMHCLCQQPSTRTCFQEGRKALWVFVCCCRPSPLSSVRAGKLRAMQQGWLKDLLTADSFGLTVSEKTKSP